MYIYLPPNSFTLAWEIKVIVILYSNFLRIHVFVLLFPTNVMLSPFPVLSRGARKVTHRDTQRPNIIIYSTFTLQVVAYIYLPVCFFLVLGLVFFLFLLLLLLLLLLFLLILFCVLPFSVYTYALYSVLSVAVVFVLSLWFLLIIILLYFIIIFIIIIFLSLLLVLHSSLTHLPLFFFCFISGLVKLAGVMNRV